MVAVAFSISLARVSNLGRGQSSQDNNHECHCNNESRHFTFLSKGFEVKELIDDMRQTRMLYLYLCNCRSQYSNRKSHHVWFDKWQLRSKRHALHRNEQNTDFTVDSLSNNSGQMLTGVIETSGDHTSMKSSNCQSCIRST